MNIFFDDPAAVALDNAMPLHWVHGEASQGHTFYLNDEYTQSQTNVSTYGVDPATCKVAQAVTDSLGNYYKPAFYYGGQFIGNYTRKVSYFPYVADTSLPWDSFRQTVWNSAYSFEYDHNGETWVGFSESIRYPVMVSQDGSQVYSPFSQQQAEVIQFARDHVGQILTVTDANGVEYTTYFTRFELTGFSKALLPTAPTPDPVYPVYLMDTSDGGILLDDAPVTATTAASLGYTISNGRAYLI